MSISTAAIKAEFGAYYLNNGQNMQRLRRLLLFSQETKKACIPIKTDGTTYQKSMSAMTSVIQSFQKAWTPKGDIQFTPNKIDLFNLKVDMDVYPDEIKGSWLGFLESNSLSRKEWPLIRYMMENHVYDQMDNDMEMNELYLGEYVAPTPGTPGLNGKSMDGLKKNLSKANIHHDTTVGALETTTVYDQFETAFELVSEVYKGKDLIIGTSTKWARAFLKDKRSLGYYQYTGPGQIDNTVDFSRCGVVGLPSMNTTNDWFITTKNNLLSISRYGENANKMDLQESKRCVSFLTDWWEGIGFDINEIVWTNVAAAE